MSFYIKSAVLLPLIYKSDRHFCSSPLFDLAIYVIV